MNFKVEHILIPETFVKFTMKTLEFNEFLIANFDDHGDGATIYVYKGARFLFYEDNFVIEELL